MSDDATVLHKHSFCDHIQKGSWPKHSTIVWKTEPIEANPTDYHWEITVELCVFCSGVALARMQNVIEACPLRDVK